MLLLREFRSHIATHTPQQVVPGALNEMQYMNMDRK